MCPRLPSARRAALLPSLNEAMVRYDVTTVARAAAFLANLMHESRCFELAREIWGPTPAQRRYEGRRDLGNTETGDGKKFMGRGFIQTTGRTNYRKVGRELGLDLEAQPALLEEPRNASLSAAFFWKSNRLNQLADCLRGKRDASEQKTLTAICKRINGGTNGLAERIVYYWRVLSVLNQDASARVAASHLDKMVEASRVIPTPETHTGKQVAAEVKTPTVAVAREEVKLQESATSFIDLAEATPASVFKATATGFWSRTGGRVMQALGVVFAALQAGSYVAWAGAVIVAIALVILVIRNRHDLRRWWNVATHKVKELAVGD
jgi:putative chitinase